MQNKKLAIIFIICVLLGVLTDVYLPRYSDNRVVDYLPYLYGSIYLVVGLFASLLLFRIYRPKYKSVEQALKIDNLLKSWGNKGKLVSIFLILFGAYNLIWHDPNMYRLKNTVEDDRWTDKDREAMIKSCMKGAVVASKKYRQITLDFCTCSIDKIIISENRKQYIEKVAKSADEEYKIDSPIIQSCVINFKRRVDSIKRQRQSKN